MPPLRKRLGHDRRLKSFVDAGVRLWSGNDGPKAARELDEKDAQEKMFVYERAGRRASFGLDQRRRRKRLLEELPDDSQGCRP